MECPTGDALALFPCGPGAGSPRRTVYKHTRINHVPNTKSICPHDLLLFLDGESVINTVITTIVTTTLKRKMEIVMIYYRYEIKVNVVSTRRKTKSIKMLNSLLLRRNL